MALLPPDPIYLFRSDMGSIHSILFQITSHVELLYAGTGKGNVHVWNLETNRQLCQFRSGQESCLSLQSLDGENLFVQHKCGLINAYIRTESDWIKYKSIDIDFYHYCRFQTFSQNELFVPLKESKVGILSTNTFSMELELSPPNIEQLGEVMVIKPMKHKQLVLVGYECGKLLLWDIRQNKILNYLVTEPCPMALDFDITLMKGIISGPSDQLQVFTLSENHIFCDRTKIKLTNPGTSVITIRPDTKIVAIGGWDSRVRIYSWKNLRPLAVLDQHRDTVQDIGYSSDKKTMDAQLTKKLKNCNIDDDTAAVTAVIADGKTFSCAVAITAAYNAGKMAGIGCQNVDAIAVAYATGLRAAATDSSKSCKYMYNNK